MLIVNRRLGSRVVCDAGNGLVVTVRLLAIRWPNRVELELTGHGHTQRRVVHLESEQSHEFRLGTHTVRIVNCCDSAQTARLGFVAPRDVVILRHEIMRNTPSVPVKPPPTSEFSEGILT